jgi:hypothetical protein
LERLYEAVLRKLPEIWPNDWFSTMTTIQLTRRSLSSSFWPKKGLLKWNTNPLPLIWFRHDIRIEKTSKGMWRQRSKLFHNRSCKIFPRVAGSIVGLSA